jgi:hypothetical protein
MESLRENLDAPEVARARAHISLSTSRSTSTPSPETTSRRPTQINHTMELEISRINITKESIFKNSKYYNVNCPKKLARTSGRNFSILPTSTLCCQDPRLIGFIGEVDKCPFPLYICIPLDALVIFKGSLRHHQSTSAFGEQALELSIR